MEFVTVKYILFKYETGQQGINLVAVTFFTQMFPVMCFLAHFPLKKR
jgi:hypothetical protein